MMSPTEQLYNELMLKGTRTRNAHAHPLYIVHELSQFFNFLNDKPLLKGLLEELSQNKPSYQELITKIQESQRIMWPKTELEKVKVCLVILEHCINQPDNMQEPMNISFWAGRKTNGWSFFLDQFFVPFFNFLITRIQREGSVLYILQKYKARAEWYKTTKEEIFAKYTTKAEQRAGEAFLDENLRQYLFDQGINYPFSQAHSPSGRTDIIAGLDSSDSLVLEVKVFDPAKQYDKSYIKQGFNQASKYVDDYNKSMGYLVIFNVSDKELRLILDTSIDYPYLEINNKRIYVIVVDIYPNRKTASHSAESYEIDKEYLIK
jgi:hypothetical protein